MMDWWLQLAQKERSMLTLTGMVLVIFVCWLGIWRPLDRVRQDTASQLDRQRTEIQWMRAAASEAARLTARTPASRQGRGNQSLLALAQETARQAGLGNAFHRGEPAAAGPGSGGSF